MVSLTMLSLHEPWFLPAKFLETRSLCLPDANIVRSIGAISSIEHLGSKATNRTFELWLADNSAARIGAC
jgi:hypothetical protein